MTNTTEMIFGALDSDKSIAVELKHDDKLADNANIYTQVSHSQAKIEESRCPSWIGRSTVH